MVFFLAKFSLRSFHILLTNKCLVTCKMPWSVEKSDFMKDVILGHHRNGRSLMNISTKLPQIDCGLWSSKVKGERWMSEYAHNRQTRETGRLRPTNECLLPENIVPTVKFDGRGIIVWEFFFQFNSPLLVRIYSKLDADTYCSILNDSVLHTVLLVKPMLLPWWQRQLSCSAVHHTLVWWQWG